jgi:hypothetical protein
MEAAKLAQVIQISERGEPRVIEPWAVILIRRQLAGVGPSCRHREFPSPADGRRGRGRRCYGSTSAQHPKSCSVVRQRQVVAQHLDAAHIPELCCAMGPRIRRSQRFTSAKWQPFGRRSPHLVLHRSEVEGGVRLEVRVDDRAALRTWLLSLGPAATLVGPEELREDFCGWLTAITNSLPSGRPAPERPSTEGRRRGPEPVAARLHRLLSIVPWLYQQESVPVAEIARNVGAQVSQVVRDLTLASMCGVPPYTADLLFGFWVEPDPITAEPMVHVARPTMMSAPLRLTARQAAAVSVALIALAALPSEDSDAVRRVREKLALALGEHPVQVTFDDPPLLARCVRRWRGQSA